METKRGDINYCEKSKMRTATPFVLISLMVVSLTSLKRYNHYRKFRLAAVALTRRQQRIVIKRQIHSLRLFILCLFSVLFSIWTNVDAHDVHNPFTDGGCLYQRKANWTKKRVCTSNDPPEHEKLGYCTPNIFEYGEIRIASQNWESAFFETWILQTVLSEMLGVPTSVETAKPNTTVDFYDPLARFEYGFSDGWTCLERAKELGDCSLVSNDTEYECCAHFVPELWNLDAVFNQQAQDIIEPATGMGTIGEEFWFVPKFTAERDPTLTSYLGLEGEENRRKLAETFKRPTRWGEYCQEVSETNCTEPDNFATRAPIDSMEADSFFVSPDYFGFFRNTSKNDCDANPFNCTGHIIDYPCGWTSVWIVFCCLELMCVCFVYLTTSCTHLCSVYTTILFCSFSMFFLRLIGWVLPLKETVEKAEPRDIRTMRWSKYFALPIIARLISLVFGGNLRR